MLTTSFMTALQHRHVLNEIESEAHRTEESRRESAQRMRDERNAFLTFFTESYEHIISAQSEMK